MNEYKELIDALRCVRVRVKNNPELTEQVPPYLIGGAADTIEELQSVVEHYAEVCSTEIPRWIPVTERLPEKYVPVLVYLPTGIMVDAYVGVYDGKNDFGINTYHVTHWMPLPAPPKNEK